jgi:hypothetical protein
VRWTDVPFLDALLAGLRRPDGRFHDVDNLHCCDDSVFPTSAG